MHGTETGQSARFRPPTTISIESHPSSPHRSPSPSPSAAPNHTTMPTPPPSPWYSAFAMPQLPPTPNMSLYVFQDKALEQQVYSSQMQWLGVDNSTANPSGDERVETVRKENEVLRWLGECVLRGLTGVLLMTLFPELEARSLEVCREKPFLSVCLSVRRNPPPPPSSDRIKKEKKKEGEKKGRKRKEKKRKEKNLSQPMERDIAELLFPRTPIANNRPLAPTHSTSAPLSRPNPSMPTSPAS